MIGILKTLGNIGSAVLGSPVLAGGMSAAAQASQNAWSARQAREQMAFQERMSSTAHQREVADLRAAGLNPLLSVNAGASSPGGAMGQGESVGGAALSSAVEIRRLKKELAVADAEIDLKHAQADATRAAIPPKQLVGSVTTDARGLYEAFKRAIGRISDRPTAIERKQDEIRLQHLKETEHSARARARAQRRGVQRQRSDRELTNPHPVLPADSLPFLRRRP